MNRFLKSPAIVIALSVLCLVAVPALCIAADCTPLETLGTITMAIGAVGTVLGLQDNNLIVTKALPNGAASVTSDAIDLESTSGEFLADVEFELTVPALTTTQLGDTQTITYIVETSAAADFGSITTLNATLAVSTGAGAAGDVAVSKRFRVPSAVLRYIRIKATKTGATNASTASLTFKLLTLAAC